jgi:hypothetical protein
LQSNDYQAHNRAENDKETNQEDEEETHFLLLWNVETFDHGHGEEKHNQLGGNVEGCE